MKYNKLPIDETKYKDFIDQVISRVHDELSDLKQKAKNGDKVAKFELDQHIADMWIEELGEAIEYIKYHQ